MNTAGFDGRPPACGAQSYLPTELVSVAVTHEVTPGYAEASHVNRYLRCTLEAHETGDHYGVVLELDGVSTGTVWALWPAGHQPGTLVVLPDCPGGDEPGSACSQFASHPGGHSDQMHDPWLPMALALRSKGHPS